MNEKVFDFFKTFADFPRLRIAALLSEESLSVEELAARLHLKPVDLPRQLAMLEELGLLAKNGDQYRLDVKAFEALNRAVWAEHRPQTNITSNDAGADDFERKVLRSYSLPDGRLREIPMQEKKRMAVLRHVIQVFEPDRRYSEKEVNETLKHFHEDTASLRRFLYDGGLLSREQNGSAYWREAEKEA